MIHLEKQEFPGTGEVLLYFVLEGAIKSDDELLQLDTLTRGVILKKTKLHLFEGKTDESMIIHTESPYEYIMLYGLGKKTAITGSLIKNALANAVRQANSLRTRSLTIHNQTILKSVQPYELGKNLALGFFLASYSFDTYKGKDFLEKKHRIADLHFYVKDQDDGALTQGFKDGQIIAEGTSLARNLVNEPASYMHPETLADEAFKIEKSSGGLVEVQVLDRQECSRLGMGAFLGVAQGSVREPKFIVLHYKGAEKSQITSKRICLIGKSITFDSGGLSLKPSKRMEDMKIDMAGGAVVLGVFSILSQLKSSPHEVWGILPACENMPSGHAMRPGDVIRALNGKTAEVLNTDAEGRLALADAVAYAEKVIKPDLIIDLATLTGACMVALGEDIAGVFGNSHKVTGQFIDAAKTEGEEAWELPLYAPYLKLLKSEIADIKNVSGRGYGGAITGALFVGEFIKDTPWVHVDIAGPAYNSGEIKGVIGKGATGWGVVTIINLLHANISI